MQPHKFAQSLWLMFIKDFGDDAGCIAIGYGLGTAQVPLVVFGFILTAISIFLKYTIFKQ